MDFVPADADARRYALIRFLSAVVFALLLLPAHLSADGGAIQFTKKAGPFTVTLFSTPVPLRVGTCDLSAMVQRSLDGSLLLDGQVEITAGKRGAAAITALATRENATNKLLYAANLQFPASGQWKVSIRIKHGTEAAAVSGDLIVLNAQPPIFQYWPYFSAVPLAILLFVLNQRLKEQRQKRR